jgi:hypothetical protein
MANRYDPPTQTVPSRVVLLMPMGTKSAMVLQDIFRVPSGIVPARKLNIPALSAMRYAKKAPDALSEMNVSARPR